MPIEIRQWGDDKTPLVYVGAKTRALIEINWPPLSDHDSPSIDRRLVEYADGNLGFYGYLRLCDALIERRCVVGLADMVDYMWMDAYTDQVPPEESVRQLLEEEGVEV